MPQIRHSIVDSPHKPAREIFNDLLGRCQVDFSREYANTNEFNWYELVFINIFYGGVSDLCCRQNITIYAHETATKYSSLNPAILNGSLQEAAEQISLVTGAAQYSHPLDIRFVYRQEEIVI
jgi:hypothetical protein